MNSATKTVKPAPLTLQLPGELSDEELDGVSGGLGIAPEKPGDGQYASDEVSPEAVGAAAVESVTHVEMSTVAALSADTAVARTAGIVITVESKDEPKEYEGSLDTVARHAPEFENTGETGVQLGTTTQNGTTTATAGITIGETEVSDAGSGVTLTTKYTVAAIAQAYTTQTSAGAGVMAGFGGSASFDLGKGVTFEASGEAVAKAGVGAGIVGGNLVIEGGVSAEASVTAEIAAQSEALDDAGTTVRGNTSATAGVEAVASAEGSIGANGISGDYGGSVGFYAKADGEAEFGNDAAAITVGGGVISPGSVSAGVSGGATIEDGKLTLSVGSEFAVAIGGVKLSFSLDVQLFDGTETTGTAEEISEVQQELLGRVNAYDAAMTDEWRRDLNEDAVAADREVQVAAAGVADALAKIEQYDKGVADTVAAFNDQRALIALARENLDSEPDPAKRADVLTMLDQDEADLKQRVASWETMMSSPAEAEKRETLFGDLKAAQGKLGVLQGFADGVHERLNLANSMTFVQFQKVIETTAAVAQERVDAARQTLDEDRRSAADLAERVAEQQKALSQERANIDRDAGGGAAIEQELDLRQAAHDERAKAAEADLAERFNQSSASLLHADKQMSDVQAFLEKNHPLHASVAVHNYTIDLANNLQRTYDSLPESAPDGDRRALSGALEGAKLIELLAGDNAERLGTTLRTHHETVVLLNKELEVLQTEVKIPGLFDEIARLFS